MHRLIELYATQVRVIREWRGGPRALVKRGVITLVVSTIAFAITAWLSPNITIDRFSTPWSSSSSWRSPTR